MLYYSRERVEPRAKRVDTQVVQSASWYQILQIAVVNLSIIAGCLNGVYHHSVIQRAKD
jgi:hypothetical protein